MPDQQNLDDLYGTITQQPEPQGLLARHFWKKHTAETNAHNMVIREIAAAAHDPQLQSPEAAHLLNSTLYSLSGKKPSDNAKFLQEGKLQQILDQAGQMEKQAREQSKKASPPASTSLSSQPINLGGTNYGRFAAPQPPPDAFGQQSAPAQQVDTQQFTPPAPPPSALGEGVGLGSVRTDFNRSQLGRQAFFADPLIAQLPVEEQINAFNHQYIGPRGGQSGAVAAPFRLEFDKNGKPYKVNQSTGEVIAVEGFTPPSPPPMEISPGASLYDPTTKTFTGTAPSPVKPVTDTRIPGELGQRLDAETIISDPNSKPFQVKAAKATIADLDRKAAQPSAAQDMRELNRMDRNYQANTKSLEAMAKPVTDAGARLSRLEDTLNQGTPAADAFVAPELLTVLAGGQGSGLRMTEAEIARIIGGRSQWETLRSTLQRWSTDPQKANSITPAQRQQMRALVSTVRARIDQKQAIVDQSAQQLLEAQDPIAQRRIVAATRKKINDVDSGVGAASVGPPPGSASIPTVNTKAEFDKLPKGAIFIDSQDGKKYKKP